MSDWILDAQNSDITPFQSCAKTMINWYNGILNSFDYPYTNGFTEGCNNKIKFSNETHMGIENLNVSETVFYIYFPISKQKSSKRQPNSHHLLDIIIL